MAALLAGLRSPTSGLLLLWGYDRNTAGTQEWRRRVVAAPQFHENHVFTGTFAFNLLMGRRWPPQPKDIAEVILLCATLPLRAAVEEIVMTATFTRDTSKDIEVARNMGAPTS